MGHCFSRVKHPCREQDHGAQAPKTAPDQTSPKAVSGKFSQMSAASRWTTILFTDIPPNDDPYLQLPLITRRLLGLNPSSQVRHRLQYCRRWLCKDFVTGCNSRGSFDTSTQHASPAFQVMTKAEMTLITDSPLQLNRVPSTPLLVPRIRRCSLIHIAHESTEICSIVEQPIARG